MSTQNEAATFTIELPESLLTPFAGTPEAFARAVRLAAAIEWYREGRVSHDKAAEIAGLSRIDFLDALDRAKLPASQVTVGESMEEVEKVTPDLFEEQYQKIGWWKGPQAASSARKACRTSGRAEAPGGRRWLVRRLRNESHLDLLSGVANMLADLGEVSLRPMVEELEFEPSREQAEALLKALGWLGTAGLTAGPFAGQLAPILAAFLTRDDPDLRDAACRATSLLAPQRALALLELRLPTETNTEVRQTIEETIAQHLTRQT